MRRIVITGPPPVQILDVAGPLEVFANAPDYHIAIATPDGSNTLPTNRGDLAMTGAVPIEQVTGRIDTLIVAGGEGAENGRYDARYVSWIADAAQRSRRVASICTGAFALAAAGLLDGKNAVTHWAFCERLAREFPNVNVMPDPIFMRDGSTYTSAGITAGIDLTLALVEEDHGHEVALNIARYLVMFLVRPGGQAQYSRMLSASASSSELRELQVWMRENLRNYMTVETLAERLGMSDRHFTRVCLRETNMTPGQLIDHTRLEAAQQMIDGTSMSLKEVADACGFRSADTMRRTFIRILGISPTDYIDRFKRQPKPQTQLAL